MTEQPSEPMRGKEMEKEEKEREKEQEKSGRSDEKQTEEKIRRDPFGATLWGAVLLWAGVVLLASNLGYLGPLSFLAPWSLILLGAGGIVLLGVVVSLLVPTYRRPIGGLLILAGVLIVGGLGSWFGLVILGPALLIGLGVFILWRAVRR
jgi:hypothetical protein